MLLLADFSALQCSGQIAGDPVTRGFAGCRAHLKHCDGQTRQQSRRRDTSAHCAAANDANFFYGTRFNTFELG